VRQKVRQFVHQSQQLLFLGQSVAQDDLILDHAAYHPRAEMSAVHRYATLRRKRFEGIDEVLQRHAPILADAAGWDNASDICETPTATR
jgi:hypothetical protein